MTEEEIAALGLSNIKPPTYLGDAVYVRPTPLLPGAIVLTTENGIEATNTIVLEPEVIANLLLYIQGGQMSPHQAAHELREELADCRALNDELLKALEPFVSGQEGYRTNVLDAARAAIAKAQEDGK